MAADLADYHVEDLDGRLVEAEIEDWGKFWVYLPKDKFRQPRIARQVRVTIQFTLRHFLGQPSN